MVSQKTVLLIDSDETVQEDLKKKFIEKLFRVVPVTSSNDAVVAVMTELPDVVILALEMADGDGLSMMENIRLMNDEVPIIALLGVPTKEKVVAAKKAGVVDIVAKPPDMERILKRVCDLLGVGEETVEAAESGDPLLTELAEEPSREDFVQAVPKGAEVININDAYPGMKVARTLVFNNVVYAEKGQILSEERISQLNRMGVSEVCVYIDAALKKLAAERKKRLLQQRAIIIQSKAPSQDGGQVFATVKRENVRIDIDITGKLGIKDEQGVMTEVACNIVDISGGGCALLTAEKIAKDQQIYLTFDLDEMKIKEMRCVVRHCVQRNAKPPEMSWRSGVFFDSITEHFREELIATVFKVQRDQKAEEMKKKHRFKHGNIILR